MKMITSSMLCLILIFAIHAQKSVDLKISLDRIEGKKSCYDISLKTSDNNTVHLAGQNYRLFYDASKLNFTEEASYSHLDPRSYGALDILNTETKGIGFLSLSIAGRKLTDKSIFLDKENLWTKTLYVCFDRETETGYDLTWANEGKTGAYATAEVTMSEWVDKDHHQVLDINIFEDFHSLKQTSTSSNNINLKVYPNPMIDYVNIEFDKIIEPEVLIIKDIIGREVVYDNVSGKQNLSYDLVNWPDGTYTIDVLDHNSERIYSQQIIKAGR